MENSRDIPFSEDIENNIYPTSLEELTELLSLPTCIENGRVVTNDTIQGSAESIDPIEVELLKLQSEGHIKIIATLLSFPGKYIVRGDKHLIDEVNKIPRKDLADGYFNKNS
jgi:hypothetical protein